MLSCDDNGFLANGKINDEYSYEQKNAEHILGGDYIFVNFFELFTP